jgi:hypothetical protein
MATFQGAATLAGASSVTAATRQKWGAAVLLLGGGIFGAAFTEPTVTKIPDVPPMGSLPAYRLFQAPALATPAQARSWRAVTPSDTIPLDPGCVGLFVSVAGTVSVKGLTDAVAVALGAQPLGATIPGRFSYVMSTGTAATVVALYV